MSAGVDDIPSDMTSPRRHQRRKVARIRLNGLVGFALVTATVLLAVFAPWIAPYSPNTSDLSALMTPPSLSSGHLLGTDDLGRDLLSRTIYGARPVILVAGTASVLAVILGALLGVAAGFSGRWTDQLIGRIADIQFSIPGLILALLALALFGTSIVNLIAVLALEFWPLHYRIARAYTQNARTQGYMEAAWLAGVPGWRAVARHIVPGLLPLLVATGTISAAFIVMTEAGLSFIGLGIQPPTADWGLMVAQGKAQLGAAWWLSIVPAVALVLLLVGVQLLGDYFSERLSLFEGDRL